MLFFEVDYDDFFFFHSLIISKFKKYLTFYLRTFESSNLMGTTEPIHSCHMSYGSRWIQFLVYVFMVAWSFQPIVQGGGQFVHTIKVSMNMCVFLWYSMRKACLAAWAAASDFNPFLIHSPSMSESRAGTSRVSQKRLFTSRILLFSH